MKIWSSIPKPAAWMLTALVGAAALVGCSTQEKVVYDAVNTKPIVGDDAMALHADWPKAYCAYPNGDVVAWSTRYPYQPKETQADSANLMLDTVTFIAQTAFLPIEFAANPPFEPQVSYGAKYAPTYTAQPVLPPPGGAKPPSGRLYTGSAAESTARGY